MSELDSELQALVELLRETAFTRRQTEANGDRPPVDEDAIVFETLRAFLDRPLPAAESLVGVARNGTNLLPRFGWVMPWGREGSGKTSVLVDLLFHAAAGIAWLGYQVERPLRVVIVVNEGIPGGLQDKLAQKLDLWEGDRDRVLDNVAIYASPWGEFSFRNAAIVEHARAFALDFEADYVALDPLHTLGTSGSGAPQETEEFKHVLRDFGLWAELGVITAHHSNKLGMVSGDWARHADTVIHVEKDGQHPATKMTLQKARPADPHELGVPVLLKWLPETFGYERQEIVKAAPVDAEKVLAQALDLLADRVPMALDPLAKQCEGNLQAVREVLKSAVAEGMIANLAAPAQPGKRQTWRLTLPEYVFHSQTFETLLAEEAAQTGAVEPSKERLDVPDVADVPELSPDGAERTSNVHPPFREGDVVRRSFARGDVAVDDDENPFL